jgi:signal peptidase I
MEPRLPTASLSRASQSVSAGGRRHRRRRGLLAGTSIAVLASAVVVTAVIVSGCGSTNQRPPSVGRRPQAIRLLHGLTVWRVPSPAMLPTLDVGADVLTGLGTTPAIGDIVVFHPPAGADSQPAVCGKPHQGSGYRQACDEPTTRESTQTFIKRVVGLPGDRLQIINGHVIRNGVEQTEPYTIACGTSAFCTFPTAIVIPSGDYFVLGDNRGVSDDSRFWGPVPRAWVVGVAVACEPKRPYCPG